MTKHLTTGFFEQITTKMPKKSTLRGIFSGMFTTREVIQETTRFGGLEESFFEQTNYVSSKVKNLTVGKQHSFGFKITTQENSIKKSSERYAIVTKEIYEQELGVPPMLGILKIFEAIEKSKRILKLHDNWDGENAIAPTEQTWKKATSFLSTMIISFYYNHYIEILPPDIDAVPDGSIDLHWRIYERELLINVSSETNMPSTFCGYEKSGKIKDGVLNLQENNSWLIEWMMELSIMR